jgi:hypothetical protein
MKGHEDDHECRFGSKADVCAAINHVRFAPRKRTFVSEAI